MTGERKIKWIVDTVFAAMVVLLAYFVLSDLIWWLLPLLGGFCIACALRPIVNALYRHSTATRRFCAVAVLLCAYLLLGAALWLGLVQLASALRDWFTALPSLYESSVAPGLTQLNEAVAGFLEGFLPQLGAQYSSLTGMLTEQLASAVAGLSTGMIAWVSGFVGGLPTMMITFVFTILSSFFISLDYERVVSFIARLVPRRHRQTLFDVKDFLVRTVFKYGRAYLILLLITFAECWAGLALLRVPGSFWWALLVACADLLPAIGTGLILLPWGSLLLLQGERFAGIGLLILWGVISLVRGLIEPKIVGDNIGLPPLVTITAMFFGLKLFGLWGMFAAPLVALVVKFLCDSGRLHLWDTSPREAPPGK